HGGDCAASPGAFPRAGGTARRCQPADASRRTAKIGQRPGTPSSACMPRSAKAITEPTTVPYVVRPSPRGHRSGPLRGAPRCRARRAGRAAMFASPLRAYRVSGRTGRSIASGRAIVRVRYAGRRLQHVRASIMADGVEQALGVQAGPQVAVGHDDALLPTERAGDDLALLGLDDGGAARPEHVLAPRPLDR